MLPADFTREEMLDEVCHDGERPCAGDGVWQGRGLRGGGTGGEGEESEGVHEHPEAAGVPSEVRETAIAVLPGHTSGEKAPVKLNNKDHVIIQYNVTSE